MVMNRSPFPCEQRHQTDLVDQSRSEGIDAFPQGVRNRITDALTLAAEGGKADTAKPLRGFGSGLFEIALAYRGEAYRVIYALQIDVDLWVIHAFQKKSRAGIKTPETEIDLIHARLRRLMEMF